MPLNETAIRAAIAEVLEGASAGVRAIDAGIASGDLAEGATDLTKAQRAVSVPVAYTVAISYDPVEGAPQQPSPLWIEAITVAIKSVSLLGSQALPSADYTAVKATAAQFGNAIRVAFCSPGKLRTTSAGDLTGICSGSLRWLGTSVTRDAPAQPGVEGGGLYELEHRFTGFLSMTVDT